MTVLEKISIVNLSYTAKDFTNKLWGPLQCLNFSRLYNNGQKSWDTFAFLGRFPIHTGPTPLFTPQTVLDACIQNLFRVSTLYRVGGGRSARKFRKGCTALGNREMTENYEYCSTVPRTFVQDFGFRFSFFFLQFFQGNFYRQIYRKFEKVVQALLAHVTPSNFFGRILESEALVYN